MSDVWRDPSETLAGYERWLSGLPLAERTQREYLRWVRLFCGWLTDGVDAQAVGADSLMARRRSPRLAPAPSPSPRPGTLKR